MVGGLKFRIWEVEGLYYPCSENKDADQLRGYRESVLRLCFRICKIPVFSQRGSYIRIGFILFSLIDFSFFYVLIEFLVFMTNLWLNKNYIYATVIFQRLQAITVDPDKGLYFLAHLSRRLTR